MRYFFEPLRCVQICTVSDALHAIQRPPPVLSAPRGLSGIECRPVQRVQRPGVRAGAPCLAWSALHLARPVLLPVLCSLSGCAGVGRGTPAGYTGSAGGGVGHARDKIFQRKRRFSAFILPTPTPSSQNETSVIVQVSKNSKKYKKTPFGA